MIKLEACNNAQYTLDSHPVVLGHIRFLHTSSNNNRIVYLAYGSCWFMVPDRLDSLRPRGGWESMQDQERYECMSCVVTSNIVH